MRPSVVIVHLLSIGSHFLQATQRHPSFLVSTCSAKSPELDFRHIIPKCLHPHFTSCHWHNAPRARTQSSTEDPSEWSQTQFECTLAKIQSSRREKTEKRDEDYLSLLRKSPMLRTFFTTALLALSLKSTMMRPNPRQSYKNRPGPTCNRQRLVTHAPFRRRF